MMILAVVGGLLFGSFAAAAAYRVPRGENVLTGRSRCLACGVTLRTIDLVPLLSYAVQRGRCARCRAPVSGRYSAIELVTAALFALVFAVLGPTVAAVAVALLAVGLVIITAVDLEFQIIPDVVLAPLALLGLAYRFNSGGTPALADAAFGAGAAFATAWSLRVLFQWLKGREALGLGDVKFFGLAGIWCGVTGLADFMLISGVAGIVFALGWRRLGHGDIFPFGPALAVALFVGTLTAQPGAQPLVAQGFDLLMPR